LDGKHREALFAQVVDLGCQAWFTGTDASLFASLKSRAQFYEVDAGSVRQVD
jgi:DNA replication and repair protein RecF